MNADEYEQNSAEPALEETSRQRVTDEAIDKALADTVPRKRTGIGLAALAFLIAVLALAAAGWMWWQGGQVQGQQTAIWQAQQQNYQDELKRLEATVAALQNSSSQESSALTGALQQRLQALERTLQADEDFRSESSAWSRAAQAALEDSQTRLNAMEVRLRNLSARSAENNTELELEEIDYLLRMAQERLELFGDTRSADRALQLADQQVVAFDNPMFIALRREIAAARQALAAADVPDMVELGADFDKVQDSLSHLAFRSSEAESSRVTEGSDAGLPWWQRLKNALSGLVTVRRVDDGALALPALADQLALRQRAWLQIEQARLAALSREQDIYLESLAQAQATINRWFVADDPQVSLALSGLQALQLRNVNPPLPDISGPWATLRSIRDTGLSPATQATTKQPAAVMEDQPAEPATATERALPASENAATEAFEEQAPESEQEVPAETETSQDSDQ